MWKNGKNGAASCHDSHRRVRFVDDPNGDVEVQVQALSNSATATATAMFPVPSSLKLPGNSRRRISFPTTTQWGTHVGSKKGSRACSKKQHYHRQADFQLAAEEIERLLLDEGNTHNANQMVDTTDDDYDDDGDDHDNHNYTYCDIHQEPDGASSTTRQTSQCNSQPSDHLLSPKHHHRRRLTLSTLSRRLRSTHTANGRARQDLHESSLLSSSSLHMGILESPVSDELTEQDVNAYGLFDSAGADEARLRYHQQRRRRQAQEQASNSTRMNPTDTFAVESIFSTDSSQTSGVIYDLKKYGSSVPFFTPILLALTTLFCVLVVARLLVSLLTVAVGWLVVILLTTRLFHQLMYRPVHLLRLLHARPLPAWVFLGGLLGMAKVCCTRILLLITQLNTVYQAKLVTISERKPMDQEDENCVADEFRLFHDIHETCSCSDYPENLQQNNPMLDVTLLFTSFSTIFSMRQDLVLIWGLVQGLVYGFQVAFFWHIILGCSSHPSRLSQWIYNNIWRFAERRYRESIRHRQQVHLLRSLRRRQHQQQLLQRCSSGSIFSITSTDDRKQCMICLEEFNEENDDDNQISSLYQRYYLVCRHSFHSCCIREWLEIKASCPICRIPLDEALENGVTTTTTSTSTTSS